MVVGRDGQGEPGTADACGPGAPADDAELDRLVAALRRVHDRVVGVEAPGNTVRSVTGLLEEAATALEPYRLPIGGPPSWDDLRRTARTRALAPPLEDARIAEDTLSGRVTFTQFYLGGNGAVHGGSIPLFYDEVLGRLANSGRPMCRTAYLNVDFRRVTPIGTALRVEARFEREEGRKRFLHAAMYDGEHLTTEAHGLFIALLPGQP